ncbi:MAG TPA: SAM-dependent methyltransferase [Kamptonema sp.]|nr:SAM-dependent methyltransferase [Kamptonema sp.]
MGLKLETVIPWGRSLDEYIAMFHLTASDRHLAILDCAGGPASFNVEMTRQGNNVISCDPIYQFTADDIAKRIQECYQTVVNGTKANLNCYNWTDIESPEKLGEVRMTAMQQFLEDLPGGIEQHRYIIGELPSLPFTNRQFDLALCSHFLFTYADHLSAEFHLASILELCRVAQEVRIFPLLKLSGETVPIIPLLLQELEARGYTALIAEVCYEFQKGGNQMLQIRTERSRGK